MAIVGGVVQERFLQAVVWIMESRLGVRAADAKTPSHYHYMYPPTLSPVCVWVYNTIPRSIIVLQRRWGRGTDAILIIGQGLHWTGVCVH